MIPTLAPSGPATGTQDPDMIIPDDPPAGEERALPDFVTAADLELTPDQAEHLAQFVTPESGHAGRLCWRWEEVRPWLPLL